MVYGTTNCFTTTTVLTRVSTSESRIGIRMGHLGANCNDEVELGRLTASQLACVSQQRNRFMI